MQKKWQILDFKESNGKEQMEIDELLLDKRINNEIPNTLRFYSWKPSCITYGFFQTIEEEVNEDIRQRFGFDLVQRITGGGCVLHDNELTYSIIVAENDIPLNDKKDILESYKLICSCLVNALQSLGIPAKHKPINDIIVDDKKISGNAQTRKGNVMLMHGTILLDVDKERFKVLKKAKLDKITSIKDLKNYTKKEITKEDLIEAITKEFKKVFKF